MVRVHELVLDALDRHWEQLDYEIREKSELKDAIELVRSHLQGSRCSLCNSMSQRMVERPELNLTGLGVDFRGAQNLRERIVRAGEAASAQGKLVNASEVARLLIGVKVSGARLQTLRRSVRDVMSRHPEEFELVAPGTYRFLGQNKTARMQSLEDGPSPPVPIPISLGGL